MATIRLTLDTIPKSSFGALPESVHTRIVSIPPRTTDWHSSTIWRSIVSELGRRFVYLDPPYYVKGRQLYMNHFTPRQHETLAAFLRGGPAFAWLLTYDRVPAIQRLYAGFTQLNLSLSYSASQRRQGSELLVHPPNVSITAKERVALQFRES